MLGARSPDGVKEIKAGGGKRIPAEPASPIVRARLKSCLTQEQFAGLLGVSKRTLEQWEQGRRTPSGAAKTLLKVAELHPEMLREIALRRRKICTLLAIGVAGEDVLLGVTALGKVEPVSGRGEAGFPWQI